MRRVKFETLTAEQLSKWMKRRHWQRTLWEETDGLCQICREPTEVDDWNMDHIRPKSKGGTGVRENLRITHEDCNTRRGNEWSARPSPVRPSAGTP